MYHSWAIIQKICKSVLIMRNKTNSWYLNKLQPQPTADWPHWTGHDEKEGLYRMKLGCDPWLHGMQWNCGFSLAPQRNGYIEITTTKAWIAQLIERLTCNSKVTGSNHVLANNCSFLCTIGLDMLIVLLLNVFRQTSTKLT